MSTNKRVYYAVYSVAVAECGTTSYTNVHGLQSVGVNTRYNLDYFFEVGQSSLYAALESIPEVELTLQKSLDGYPLIYHLCTKGATSPTLLGRANQRSSFGLSIFQDTQDSASGTPLAQMVASGTYPSAISYTFPVNGGATEDVTVVGNSKTWLDSYTITAFDNTDAPIASGSIQRRQHVLMGSGSVYSQMPTDIPGITSQGWNILQSDGTYPAHIQQIRTSTNLGRDPLFELGHKGAYFRYAQFPVQVQTDIDVLTSSGDTSEAQEEADNLTDQAIVVRLLDGTVVDLGSKNKMQGVTFGGGNAGQQGGNATSTFSYINFNDFTVTHPQDPSGL